MAEETKYKYAASPEELSRLKIEFTYQPPKDDQTERYVALRDLAHILAVMIVRMSPPSDEQDNALRRLGEAVMWSNAAIARNE